MTLAILAGGEGSRMGRPKGSLVIHGQPILGHLFHRLAWPGPTLLVTAPGREHPPGWELFDAECVDPVAGEGPLRGILTALEYADTDMIAVATVDMPGIGAAQLKQLAKHLGTTPVLGAMYERGGVVEPFPAVYRRSAEDSISYILAAGQRSVHELVDELPVALFPAQAKWDPSVWANLNEPADFEAFLKTASGENHEAHR